MLVLMLFPKAKFACYFRCFMTSCFCILVPYNEKVSWKTIVTRGLLDGWHWVADGDLNAITPRVKVDDAQPMRTIATGL